jgi:hypothetical protein
MYLRSFVSLAAAATLASTHCASLTREDWRVSRDVDVSAHFISQPRDIGGPGI